MQDVAAEGALLAGGGVAILLQVADPAVAAGVAKHSDFAERPLLRLQTTLTYVYAVVSGSDERIAAVRASVDRAHAPVERAFDPDLQLWVAATLYRTAADLDERIWGPLGQESADRVYRDYAVLGTALQVPPAAWPADRAAFTEYWNRRIAALHVSADARRIALDLLHPRTAPWWLKAGMPLARLLTAGLLPPELRAAYGLPWSSARERRFERTLAALATVYRRLPRRIRQWPSRYFAAVPS
jgi:uncharacterized protein (DUF2236 family)